MTYAPVLEPDRAVEALAPPPLSGDACDVVEYWLDPAARARSADLAAQRVSLPDPDVAPARWEAFGQHRLATILGSGAERIAERTRRDNIVTRIRGLAGDSDPGPTPYSGKCDVAPLTVTLLNLFGVIGLMGAEACAYADENDARIIRHVVAVPDLASAVSSHGWREELPWHMDCAYRPLRAVDADAGFAPSPHWLVFAIVTDSAIPITILSVEKAVRRVSPEAQRALCRPDFSIVTPASVTDARTIRDVPILGRDGQGRWISRFAEGLCEGNTADARDALDEFRRILGDPDLHQSVSVERHDIVVIDNRRTLHMRPAYQPHWDGSDRWFMRVYANARTAVPRARRVLV